MKPVPDQQASVRRRRTLMTAAIIAAVIIIDQIIKFWVKTHFYLGESVTVTSWFKLLFIENNGMAFGMEIGSKLFLTLFRLLAVGALIWYISRLIRRNADVSTGYLVCLSLITAGAAGNIFDCVFYGVIFNNPMPPEVATLFPADGGYASLFHGKVVDMFYIPLFSFYWPDWMPFVGGDRFSFFDPVFNFADAAITVGIIILIFFYYKNLTGVPEEKSKEDSKTERKIKD